MSSRLNPYLTFNGDAREAMEFYRSVFGGELQLTTFAEFGAPDPAIADKIMHANLHTPAGYTLMASDTAPKMWGDEYGQCVDRFGVPWMVNIAVAQS